MNKFTLAILAPTLVVLALCVPTLLTACDKLNTHPAVKQAFAPPAVVDPVLLEAHKAVTDPAPPTAVEPSKVDKAAVTVVNYRDYGSSGVDNPAVRSKQHFAPNPDAESRAYSKAFRNAARATCLRLLLDTKVAYDQRAGRITDIGNVRDLPICGHG